MDELKRFTIKTWYSTETKVCYDIEEYLCETCFCDAYEVIAEEPAGNLQWKFDKYFSMIPDELFNGENAYMKWKMAVLELVNGWYDDFNDMIKNNIGWYDIPKNILDEIAFMYGSTEECQSEYLKPIIERNGYKDFNFLLIDPKDDEPLTLDVYIELFITGICKPFNMD